MTLPVWLASCNLKIDTYGLNANYCFQLDETRLGCFQVYKILNALRIQTRAGFSEMPFSVCLELEVVSYQPATDIFQFIFQESVQIFFWLRRNKKMTQISIKSIMIMIVCTVSRFQLFKNNFVLFFLSLKDPEHEENLCDLLHLYSLHFTDKELRLRETSDLLKVTHQVSAWRLGGSRCPALQLSTVAHEIWMTGNANHSVHC